MPTPEYLARLQIDQLLTASGWVVQDRGSMNLYAGCGVAVREFPVEGGFGITCCSWSSSGNGVEAGREAAAVGTEACV